MKIMIKVGEVVVEYTKETEPDSANAATAKEGWSNGASHEQLLSTVRELVKHAKELHDSMYT